MNSDLMILSQELDLQRDIISDLKRRVEQLEQKPCTCCTTPHVVGSIQGLPWVITTTGIPVFADD